VLQTPPGPRCACNSSAHTIAYSQTLLTFPSEIKGTQFIQKGVEHWKITEKHLEAVEECRTFSDLLRDYIRHAECEFRVFCCGGNGQRAMCFKWRNDYRGRVEWQLQVDTGRAQSEEANQYFK
jgi:hypothetical protein